MSKILSQDEIDKLIKDMQEGKIPPKESEDSDS